VKIYSCIWLGDAKKNKKKTRATEKFTQQNFSSPCHNLCNFNSVGVSPLIGGTFTQKKEHKKRKTRPAAIKKVA